MADQLKVLLADPSRDIRDGLESALSREGDLAVPWKVHTIKGVLDTVGRAKPDAVVLDIELPGAADGVKKILELNRGSSGLAEVGVIVVARRSLRDAEETIQALENGAFDFVLKPDASEQEDVVAALLRQLRVKLRSFASKRIFSSIAGYRNSRQDARQQVLSCQLAPSSGKTKAVLIGVSTGGPKILANILPRITLAVDIPIFVVQHMPPDFTRPLAESLNNKCRARVVEAARTLDVQQGTVYLARGGQHMLLAKDHKDRPVVTVSDDPPEEGCRPSVNMLFRSAAEVYGGDVVAVVLTGMGADGSQGLKPLKDKGAYVIAQDKETSVVWGMPGSAVGSGLVDKVLPYEAIPDEILKVAKG